MSGIYGDFFSITDQNQFIQMLTIYNDFSKNFAVKNYLLDHNNDSVIFINKKDITLQEFEQMSNKLYSLKLQHDLNLICDNKQPEYSKNVFKFYLQEKIKHNVIKNN